jgi:membrane-bound metal-dependent hydrolase YbcI (DUF457 family)
MTYRTHVSLTLGITSIALPIEKITNQTFLQDHFFKLQEYFILNTGIDSLFITNTSIAIFLFIFLLIGSLFPDIDHGESYLQKRTKRLLFNKLTIPFYMLGIFFLLMTFFKDSLSNVLHDIYVYIDIYLKTALIWVGSIFVGTYTLLFISAKFFKHRGPTHSALYLTLFFGLIYGLLHTFDQNIVYKTVTILLFWGSITHLMADMFTKSGVMILNPITRKSFRFLPKKLCIVTNSKPEFLIFYPLGYLITIASLLFYFI